MPISRQAGKPTRKGRNELGTRGALLTRAKYLNHFFYIYIYRERERERERESDRERDREPCYGDLQGIGMRGHMWT